MPRLFRPSDAEQITGVDQSTQRAWRGRGYVASDQGLVMARFDAFGLARLTVFHLLAARGIGPERTMKVVDSVAIRIVAHAERDPRAFPVAVPEPERFFTACTGGPLARWFTWFPSSLVGFGDSLDDLAAGRGLFSWAGGVLPDGLVDTTANGALIALDLNATARAMLARSGPIFREESAGRLGVPVPQASTPCSRTIA